MIFSKIKKTYVIYASLILLSLFTILSASFFSYLFSFMGEYSESVAKLISILFLIAIMLKLKILKNFSFQVSNFFIGILLGFYILILIACNLFGNLNSPLDLQFIGILVFINFIIGLWEEILCRGILLNVLLKYSTPMKAVLGSSLIFCLMHTINFFTESTHPVLILSQVVYTFFLGVYFASITYVTKSLWPAIILHSCLDLSNNIADLLSSPIGADVVPSFSQIVSSGIFMVVVVIPAFIVGIIIIKKRDKISHLIKWCLLNRLSSLK